MEPIGNLEVVGNIWKEQTNPKTSNVDDEFFAALQ